MNKDVMNIIEEYCKHGTVDRLTYRGRLIWWDACNPEKFNIEWSDKKLFPTWRFRFTDGTGKYWFDIVRTERNYDGSYEYCVRPGRESCYTNRIYDFKDIYKSSSKSSIEHAHELNHWTPHPTCKIVEE